MSDSFMSMSEGTGCDKFGHQWQLNETGIRQCAHCGEEREDDEEASS